MSKNSSAPKSLNRIIPPTSFDDVEPLEMDDAVDYREAAMRAREHDQEFDISISLDI